MLSLNSKTRHSGPFLMIKVNLLLGLIRKLVDGNGLPRRLVIDCSLHITSVVLWRYQLAS